MLTVTPGESAVIILLNAHHDAAVPEGVHIKNRISLEVPADFTLGIGNPVNRVRGPLQRAAFRAVPNGLSSTAGNTANVIHVVQTIRKLPGRGLNDSRLRENGIFALGASQITPGRRRVHLIGFVEVFCLIVPDTVVTHLNMVDVVRVQAENRDAAVSHHLTVGHVIGDFLTAGLRDDADADILQHIAAVMNDGGERRDLIRIHLNLADMTLNLIDGLSAGRTAKSEGGRRKRNAGCCGDGHFVQLTTGDTHIVPL